MEYSLNIKQYYNIEVNDQDLSTYLVPRPPESYDKQGYDGWNETVDTLSTIIRERVDKDGASLGILTFEDLVDENVYHMFLRWLKPQYIEQPTRIRFRWNCEYHEETF